MGESREVPGGNLREIEGDRQELQNNHGVQGWETHSVADNPNSIGPSPNPNFQNPNFQNPNLNFQNQNPNFSNGNLNWQHQIFFSNVSGYPGREGVFGPQFYSTTHGPNQHPPMNSSQWRRQCSLYPDSNLNRYGANVPGPFQPWPGGGRCQTVHHSEKGSSQRKLIRENDWEVDHRKNELEDISKSVNEGDRVLPKGLNGQLQPSLLCHSWVDLYLLQLERTDVTLLPKWLEALGAYDINFLGSILSLGKIDDGTSVTMNSIFLTLKAFTMSLVLIKVSSVMNLSHAVRRIWDPSG